MNQHIGKMYALLVGINKYASPKIHDLRGCVNDVDAMEQLLCDRFGVPQENIRKLTDTAATHQAIKEAFRTHLIESARAWVADGRQGEPPAFLFHYSGHGSQAIDETGTEPDGLDETLVPHDSRTPGIFDIKDWEVGQLLEELVTISENVTVILDCCHSGSGTRVIAPDVLPARCCDPDLRPQPTQRPVSEAQTRGAVTASGWMQADRYVLLAGCRDRELANELVVREGDNYGQYGALSYFLIKELAQMNPYHSLTYRELHEKIRYQVNSRFKTQMPQCEGDRDREVFGGLRPACDEFLTVTVDQDRGLLWVEGGLAHGLTDGSELQVYPPDTRTLEGTGEPFATLRVKNAGAVRSICEAIEAEQPIPNLAKAVIYGIAPVSMRYRVILNFPQSDDALKRAVQDRLEEKSVKNYIEIISEEVPADFRITKVEDKLQIQDGTGELLAAPFDQNDLHGLGRDLAHLIRYYNALELSNKASNSALNGKVSIELKKLSFDQERKPIAEPFSRTTGGELIIETEQPFVLEVTNNADIPLYFSALEFGYAWDISIVYPEVTGAHEALEPGKTYSLGLSADGKEQFVFRLPEKIPEIRETFKVIATKEEADFYILQQEELKIGDETRGTKTRRFPESPLNLLFDLAMEMDDEVRGACSRKIPAVKDEWTAAQMSVLIIQSATGEYVMKTLKGGCSTSIPGYNVALEPPEGFAGKVRILTEHQSLRTADGDSTVLKSPAGLAGWSKIFQPVSIPSETRADYCTGATGVVIEIDMDNGEACRKISMETPLKLRLPVELTDEKEPVMVLAYDGSLFYPVGRPGMSANVLNVEWLPEPVPPDETPTRSMRSMGRTLKLYLYKHLTWNEPSLGLHKARFVPGDRMIDDQPEAEERCYEIQGNEVRYRDLRTGELQAGQKVALFVHGFSSETRWMMAGPGQFFAEHGIHYDHILTFDYESFNTSISDNGQILAKALQAAGFGPDDDISLDVFAHSTGTLVIRSMVELWGGDTFVDRCFLGGPPNLGTCLADAKRLITWVGTLLLNQLTSTPPAIVAKWVLNKISEEAVGIEDVRPGSDFLKQLNNAERPAKVPYYILVGRNELSKEAQNVWERFKRTVERLADAALDALFHDQHDMVISVHSMQTVRNGNYPLDLLHRQLVPCDHFGYFNTKEAQQQLLEWLKS